MTEDNEDDFLAGEYVLGTLDGATRDAVDARRLRDPVFAALLGAWELRLAPLSEGSRAVEPPAHLWQEILTRIASLGGLDRAAPSAAASNVILLTRQVRRWKQASAVVTALAACLALWIAASPDRATRPGPTLIAFLQKQNDAPAYLMKADLDDRVVSVRPVAAIAPAGRSYELWVIDPQIGAPKSLGVLDPSTSTHALPSTIPPDILQRATYAVTEEQSGGSPTGAPTSPPVFFGHLIPANP